MGGDGLAEICGLKGLRPPREMAAQITCPPYDVVKEGSKLEHHLRKNDKSLFHITLGDHPKETLARFIRESVLIRDDEPAMYVYEQRYGDKIRRGFLTGVKVSGYETGDIIRHEKTFDEKVERRMWLTRETGYAFEPVWLLTKSPVRVVLDQVADEFPPLYEFTSDFAKASELHGIVNRVFRIPEDGKEARALKEFAAHEPLYIADGHHRYHSALCLGQDHCLAYICETDDAEILAYNRVVSGLRGFQTVRDRLALVSENQFRTPPKNSFMIYAREGIFSMKAGRIPDDPIGRLDCRILEEELYPLLGLSPEMIEDEKHFDFYPESEMNKMTDLVDKGAYDLAVALHPVDIRELMAVADLGVHDPNIVMPEKSTFFAPKILSGLFALKIQAGERLC
jgi:uncharacterized protein (DUF1015 family)